VTAAPDFFLSENHKDHAEANDCLGPPESAKHKLWQSGRVDP
jgi:hypothetical protein